MCMFALSSCHGELFILCRFVEEEFGFSTTSVVKSYLYIVNSVDYFQIGEPSGLAVLGRNLVDPASSHMLVSKIKPCMSQYKSLHVETANGSLKQL